MSKDSQETEFPSTQKTLEVNMPKGFEECIKKGGRVRTITPKKGTYIHICYLNGKAYRGEIKHTKKKS